MKNALNFSLLLILSLIIISGIATWKEVQDFQGSAKDPTAINHEQTEFLSKELGPLHREKTFKESLLLLSRSDSIALVINLKDSTINLTIKGIIIHQTKIDQFKMDPLLLHFPDDLYLSKYSKPMTKVMERSTIIKEAIVVRQAPKDPIEASLNAFQPDTLIQNAAFFEFILDTNVKLIFEQNTSPTLKEKLTRLKFLTPFYFQSLTFFAQRQNDRVPAIKIMSSAEGLRIIYRALPTNPKVVVYLPEDED